MDTSLEFYRQKKSGLASVLLSGVFVLGLALAAPLAFAAGGGAGGGGGVEAVREPAAAVLAEAAEQFIA